ncbi:hypothetical protein BGZ93_009362, partial [Podila epicladia]
FADNVKLLQNYPPVDIQPILHLATVVRDERVGKKRPSSITRNSSSNNSFSNGTSSSDTHESAPSAQQQQSRPSIDLRIWSSRSSVHDAPLTSSSENVIPTDLKALMIDGVQNSDRLDHNLEGIDHRSPMYTPNSNFRDNPHQTNVSRSGSGLSGLNLEGIWSRNAAPGKSSSRPVSTRERLHPSPSSLSVDNYVLTGRESRPQTGTWAEAFSQFKARLVGTGNSPDQGAVATLPTDIPVKTLKHAYVYRVVTHAESGSSSSHVSSDRGKFFGPLTEIPLYSSQTGKRGEWERGGYCPPCLPWMSWLSLSCRSLPPRQFEPLTKPLLATAMPTIPPPRIFSSSAKANPTSRKPLPPTLNASLARVCAALEMEPRSRKVPDAGPISLGKYGTKVLLRTTSDIFPPPEIYCHRPSLEVYFGLSCVRASGTKSRCFVASFNPATWVGAQLAQEPMELDSLSRRVYSETTKNSFHYAGEASKL